MTHLLSNAIVRMLALLAVLVVVGTTTAQAGDYLLVIKDHRFEPATLTVPAGTRFKLVVENRDPTPEEFESHDLNREKIIPGGTTASIWVGPLEPGEYAFFGEFNEATAQGKLIVK